MPSQVRLFLFVAALPFFAPTVGNAQHVSPRERLLRCVPPDHGICFAVHDLRGHSETWKDQTWVRNLDKSPLVKTLLGAPEFQDVLKFQGDLKNHLGIDWTTLRDEILGDAVIFAYRPAPGKKTDDEQGMLLIQARKGAILADLIERLNGMQKKSKELKALEEKVHQGVKYFRRVTTKATHFYLQDGAFFALTGDEDSLRFVIESRLGKNPEASVIGTSMARAGADKALLTLWVNPRVFDAELKEKAKGKDSEGAFLNLFLTYWQAFDAIVVSFDATADLEMRIALQARENDLPSGARKLFREQSPPSDLWTRFPENALFTMASRTDIATMFSSLVDASPPQMRKTLMEGLQQSVGAALGLNVAKDVLPNLGPDWGVCVTPANDAKELPQVLAALAIKPGEKEVDQAAFKGLNLLAGWAVFFHNRNNPDDRMQLHTSMQDKVEVKYLATDKAFPPGFQPAFALKNGYLVMASAPSAIARFKSGAGKIPSGPEAPLVRLSSTEIAKALRGQRQRVTDHIAVKNNISKDAAQLGLAGVLSILDLIDRVELNERAEGGQIAWILRIRPTGR